MSVQAELDALVKKMNEKPEHIAAEEVVFQFNLDESGTFQVIIKDGKVSLEEGSPEEAQVTLKTSDSNLIKLLNDELNTTMAFMTGRLKVDGNIGLALKLQEILKKYK